MGSLAVSDLLVQGVVRQVGLGVEPGVPEGLGDLLRVLLERSGDGDDDDLSGRQPEWPWGSACLWQLGTFWYAPLSARGLGNDGDESLDGSENGTVDHDWSGKVASDRSVVRPSVLEVESLGQVEVELNIRCVLLPDHKQLAWIVPHCHFRFNASVSWKSS